VGKTPLLFGACNSYSVSEHDTDCLVGFYSHATVGLFLPLSHPARILTRRKWSSCRIGVFILARPWDGSFLQLPYKCPALYVMVARSPKCFSILQLPYKSQSPLCPFPGSVKSRQRPLSPPYPLRPWLTGLPDPSRGSDSGARLRGNLGLAPRPLRPLRGNLGRWLPPDPRQPRGVPAHRTCTSRQCTDPAPLPLSP